MKRSQLALLVPLLLTIQLAAACAGRVPARVNVPSPVGLAALRSSLERVFSDQNFVSAQWGVEIISLDRGDVLYERNSTRLYMPASNNKLLTTTAALIRLGPDYRYTTRVQTDGTISEGLLRGNLIVVGSGDPSNAPRFFSGDPFHMFKEWAARLKERGVNSIDGNLIGDDSAFAEQALGTGWEWDDLAYGYAAPVSALQFNENLATIAIEPGSREGDAARLKAAPLEHYLTLSSTVLTGASGSESDIRIERAETGETLLLSGSIPFGSKPVNQTVAVRYPGKYYLEALKHCLLEAGVDVSRCETKVVRGAGRQNATLLWSQTSPTLIEIAKPLLKVSQNLYAETLARTLGLTARGEGSFARGKEVVEETLSRMAVEKGTYVYADGSGLSRLNLVSADILARILKFMYRQKFFPQFYEALPVAGVDGTISGRMKGTKAENNVHAKTGSIANVRALSGYLRSADGEMLVFSFLSNNFLVSGRAADFVTDSALEILSNFSR